MEGQMNGRSNEWKVKSEGQMNGRSNEWKVK